ncbi:MAG: SatD family protein [Terriglobales bacterium]
MSRRAQCYIAVIADMVKSRELPSAQRGVVQRHFQDLITALNKEYRDGIASQFAITLGDEFQGLLNTSRLIPDLIWRMEENFPDRELRVGIGVGTLDTPLQKFAINVDGPVLHAAREAIETAKKNDLLGGVFRHVGSLDDVLNGIARLLWFHRSNWTVAQRKIANLLRKGMSQSEAAERLGIKRQVVSKQVAASGWVPYAGTERAWRIILQDYVDPMIGKKS